MFSPLPPYICSSPSTSARLSYFTSSHPCTSWSVCLRDVCVCVCAHLYISVSPASKGGFKTLRPEHHRQPLMLLSPLACVFRGAASYLLPLCCRRGGCFIANSGGRHWASPAAPRHPSSLSPQTNALRSSYYFLSRFKLSLALTRAQHTRFSQAGFCYTVGKNTGARAPRRIRK